MNPKAFISLAAITAVMVLAAIVAVVVQPRVSTVSLTNEPAFEVLRREPDAATKVVIENRKNRISVHRQDDGTWAATDRFNYPVKSDLVYRLIAELADMQLIEPKTRQPDRYKRLELESIDAEGSFSQLVRLYDRGDNLLAEAIIGRPRQRVTGVQAAGTYIRRPDEAQTWLASGSVTVDGELADWLVDEVLNIFSKTVQQVEINATVGGAYTAFKETAGVALKVISELPEGKEVRDGATSRLAAGLTNVSMVDVMRREDFVLPEEHIIATYQTFDGVEVRVELAQVDDKGWAAFTARYVGAEGEVDAEAAAAANLLVEEINSLADGWAYELQEHVYARLTLSRDDIIEDIPPPGAADPAGMIPGMPPMTPGVQQQIPPEVLQQLMQQQQLQQQQVAPGAEQQQQIPPEVMQQLMQQQMQQQLQQQQQAPPAPAP
jgi:hypothetical protein